jgi:hypothetical protein
LWCICSSVKFIDNVFQFYAFTIDVHKKVHQKVTTLVGLLLVAASTDYFPELLHDLSQG